MDGKGNQNNGTAERKKVYGDIDLSNLQYLEHRDLTRVAERLTHNGIHVDAHYVGKVKRLVVKNTAIMAELLKLGGERKRLLEKSIG